MYIKKVTKTNGRTKKKYTYLHLVESVRAARGPRQKLVCNLGDPPIGPRDYKALADRIEDLLIGRKTLFDVDPEVEKHARAVADKIFEKRAREIEATGVTEFENVDVKSFEVSKPRSLGPEYVGHVLWRQLGMGKVLRAGGVSERVLSILEALVVGRLVCPGSER